MVILKKKQTNIIDKKSYINFLRPSEKQFSNVVFQKPFHIPMEFMILVLDVIVIDLLTQDMLIEWSSEIGI